MSEDDLHRLILTRLDSQAADISEIRQDVKDVKAQTTITNGRVNKLELWRARTEGARAAIGAAGTVAVTIFASAIGGIVVFLLSK